MPTISLTLPVSGTTVTAGLHSGNYGVLQTLLNGGLDTSNWATGKIFPPSKLTQEGATTGQTLVWNGTIWAPTVSTSAPGYATTLPGSPVDTQESILVDALSPVVYEWRFRYNSGSSNTDKWEFEGGVPVNIEATSATVTNAAYADMSSVVSFTVPRAGVYKVVWGAWAVVTGGVTAHLTLKKGAAAAADAESVNPGGATNFLSGMRMQNITCAASDVLKLQAKMSSGTLTVATQILQVLPLRVS